MLREFESLRSHMKVYREEVKSFKVYDKTVCDGCGKEEDYPITINIAVNEGEEGGKVDSYDFCEDCFNGKIEALKAAGSTAPLVLGYE